MNQITSDDEHALIAALHCLRARPPASIEDATILIHNVRRAALVEARVTEGHIGRFWETPCYIVETERFKAALPGRPASQIRRYDDAAIERVRMYWSELKWFHPPYLMNGDLAELRSQVSAGVAANRALENFLIQKYDLPSILAATVSQKYSKIPEIKEHADAIWDCMQVFYAGFHGPAITALLPIVEACCCNRGGQRISDKVDQALAQTIERTLKHYCDKLVFGGMWVPDEYREQDFLESEDEVARCLFTFQRYITQSLHANTRNFSESNKLNRNGILHGIAEFDGYQSRANFFKLISVLDMVAFAHTLGHSGLRVGLARASPERQDPYQGAILERWRTSGAQFKSRTL